MKKALALLLLIPSLTWGDVYKYVDNYGNVYFSDKPMHHPLLTLDWKRTAARLVAKNAEQSELVRRKQAEIRARLQQSQCAQ